MTYAWMVILLLLLPCPAIALDHDNLDPNRPIAIEDAYVMEGCASILWKTAEKAKDAAEQLGLTAGRLKELGLVDKVVREPIGGAHRKPVQMGRRLKAVLLNELDALEAMPIDVLLQRRYERLRGYGAYEAA